MTGISSGLQENLLTVLCFDEKNSKVIRNTIDVKLFEGMYRDIASRAYTFIDDFGVPPKDHLPDLFDDVFEDDKTDPRQIKTIRTAILNLHEFSESVNVEYTMSKALNFVRQQHLKAGIMDAARILQRDDEEALDTAEVVLNEALGKRIDIFNPGLFLTDPRSLDFLKDEEASFPTGIPEFDRRTLGPRRKELHLFIALPKRGKTHWLVNLGKRAMLGRLKVCHVTLEMSEERMAQRYYQSLFAIPKRRSDPVEHTRFELDDLNRLIGLEQVEVKPKLALNDPNIARALRDKTDMHGLRLNKLVIKQFPTGNLTINELKAYLDSLENSAKFVPDLLILDYPDLMSIKSDSYRTDLGRVYKELRGIAVERNLALAAASQSSKAGMSMATVTEAAVAEDFSKIATADVIITYSQTDQEKALGLARLYVAGGRNDEDKFTVLISQSYATGQFVLKSTPMVSRYPKFITELLDDDDD